MLSESHKASTEARHVRVTPLSNRAARAQKGTGFQSSSEFWHGKVKPPLPPHAGASHAAASCLLREGAMVVHEQVKMPARFQNG